MVGPLQYSNFKHRHWTTAVERAGLSGLEIHELRHGRFADD